MTVGGFRGIAGFACENVTRVARPRFGQKQDDMRTRLYLLFASLALVTACSAATDPAVPALDGPWSSGHTLIGLNMAVNLTWTRDHVVGSGSYGALPPPVHCGTTAIPDANTLTLAATRPSSTEIRGQVTLGNGAGTPLAYQGALIASAQNAGFERIEGFLIAPDGTECALTLFHGLVP